MHSERPADRERALVRAASEGVSRASLGGGEAEQGLLAVLEAARLWTGAQRAFWTAPGRAVLAAPRCAAGGLGRALDWGVLARLRAGEVVRLEPAELARSPRFAGRLAAGGARLVLCAAGARVMESAGAVAPTVLGLWFDAKEGDAPEHGADDAAREAASLLASLAELERVGRAHAEARSLAALGRRASHLAHDLRHLMTVARLSLERARIEGGVEEGAARELAPVLLAASDLCAGALHGDDDAHEDPHEDPRTLATCELLPVLHDAARTAATVAGRGDVRIRVRCPGELRVRGARAQVLRLFVNLTLNAIEASPPQGEVRLEGEPAGGRAVTRVVDQGPGLAADELARLVSNRPPPVGLLGTRRRPGRGFGLDSVRAGVAALAGTIAARGDAVLVSLPCAQGSETIAGEALVLVDSDEARRGAVERVLVRKGYAVVAVGEPLAALAVLGRAALRPLAVAVLRGTPGRGLGRLVERARGLAIPIAALPIAAIPGDALPGEAGGGDARALAADVARLAGAATACS